MNGSSYAHHGQMSMKRYRQKNPACAGFFLDFPVEILRLFLQWFDRYGGHLVPDRDLLDNIHAGNDFAEDAVAWR